MSDEMTDMDLGVEGMDDLDALSELDNMFAEDDERIKQAEENVLTQNLSGFASCFPDWDLHPPVK